MRWLSLLSRVAFICNLAFLLSVLMQWKPFVSNQALLSTIVVTGYILGPLVFSPVVNILYAVLLYKKRPLHALVPLWLVWVNFIFLIVQLLFVLFFLHDPFNS
jgi:hypothetical protein